LLSGFATKKSVRISNLSALRPSHWYSADYLAYSFTEPGLQSLPWHYFLLRVTEIIIIYTDFLELEHTLFVQRTESDAAVFVTSGRRW